MLCSGDNCPCSSVSIKTTLSLCEKGPNVKIIKLNDNVDADQQEQGKETVIFQGVTDNVEAAVLYNGLSLQTVDIRSCKLASWKCYLNQRSVFVGTVSFQIQGRLFKKR